MCLGIGDDLPLFLDEGYGLIDPVAVGAEIEVFQRWRGAVVLEGNGEGGSFRVEILGCEGETEPVTEVDLPLLIAGEVDAILIGLQAPEAIGEADDGIFAVVLDFQVIGSAFELLLVHGDRAKNGIGSGEGGITDGQWRLVEEGDGIFGRGFSGAQGMGVEAAVVKSGL